ncbi:FkbM family methyltransferase [Salinibacter ruber]|uniref:FkbM family methyltransferase n=1 Tax=Salinibacter ruber TaxID=146919 RepID=UPI000E58E9FF|nr:FkbM family methyltransferase [Salinibacter ruber]
MKYNIIKLLSYVFSNRLAQNILGLNILVAQHLRGVGAGAGVLSSGEEKVVETLVESTNSDSTCIFDVGANKGNFISLFKRRMEGNFEIHSFEPLSSSFDILQSRYGTSKYVRINNCALGNSVGEENIFYDEKGSSLASMTKRDIAHDGKDMDKTEKVKVDTLDNYCSKKGIDRIDILKVDVEGHELDVFEGARGMFDDGRIKYVMFEFGGCNIDTRTFMKDYFKFFRSVGYKRINRITPSGYLFEVSEYNEEIEKFMTTNYLVEM